MNLLNVANGKWVRVIGFQVGFGAGHHQRARKFGFIRGRDMRYHRRVRGMGAKRNKGLKNHLAQLGFLPGNTVRIIRRAPLFGPLLVEIEGREIVIGRGIARQVLVKDI